jgi:hypothetical protein
MILQERLGLDVTSVVGFHLEEMEEVAVGILLADGKSRVLESPIIVSVSIKKTICATRKARENR